MNFSFWRLLIRQWSWKNDKGNLAIALTLSLLMTGLYVGLDVIVVEPIDLYWYGITALFVGNFIWGVLLYYLVKLILMTVMCLLVVSQCKKGDSEAISMYKEMLY